MSNSRIDELRPKFDENPRRYFAPLANEYRKSGDLDTAIALCREHLPRLPGHMSGHIVYGQALFEAGQLDESRQVFEAALTLDPENIIALQHLGKIAVANGDSATARRWYERVLDADPRNDEIAHQLASLFTPATPVPAVEAPTAEVEPAEVEPAEVEPVESEAAGVEDVNVANAVALEPGVVEWTPDAESADVEAARPEADSDARDHAAEERALDDAFADAAAEAAQSPDYEVSAIDAESEGRAESDGSAGDQEPVDVGDALAAFASHDPSGALDPDRVGPPSAPADVESLISLDDHDYSVEFEEGLIAPEWTETAEIAARISGEHRPVTPATPQHSVEAMEAFGREPVDPEPAPVVEPIEYGERELAGDAADANTDDADANEIVADYSIETETGSYVDAEVDVLVDESMDASVDVVVDAQVPTPVDPLVSIDAALIDDATGFDALVDGSASDDAGTDAAPFDEAMFGGAGAVAAVDADTADVGAPDDELALPEQDIRELESIPESAPDVRAVARALALDSRASGETEAIRVEVRDDVDDGVGISDAFGHASDVHADAANSAENSADDSADDSAEDSAIRAADAVDSADADVAQAAEDTPPAFVTETMAELLVSQGFTERAVSVYEELVRRRPFDPVLVSRLDELRARLTASDAAAEDLAEAPAADDMLVSTGNVADVEPATPAPHFTPVATPLIASLPVEDPERDSMHSVTARERFRQLASRRVPRRTPPRAAVAVESPSEGLAGLFGTVGGESGDEYAARAFADAFAPMDEPPLGATATPVFVTRTATAPSSPAVSSTPTPASTPSQSHAPSASNAGFSFDRFFPDPATVNRASATPAAPSSPSASANAAPAASPMRPAGSDPAAGDSPPVNEDLAQFAAWLKGLDQS